MASNLHEEILLSWNAPDFMRFHRGWLWYGIAFGLLGGVGISSWIFGNWTLSLVCVSVGIWFVAQNSRKPHVHRVQISDMGINLGEKTIPYSQIKAFSMVDGAPFFNELHLWVNDRWHPERHVFLVDVNPAVVRQVLLGELREREGEKPAIADILVRMFKLV